MKYPIWGLVLFIIVVVILILRTMRSRDMIYEGFDSNDYTSEDVVEEDKCPEYSSCNTCTNASGCAWCPATNKCLNNNTLTISNLQCNQNNSILTSMHCESNQPAIIPPDFTFYKDMIADKPKPPNVGIEYAI